MDITSKSFASGTRIALSDLDLLNLKRSDYVAFTLSGKSKTRVNLKYNTGKGTDKEYMFYIFSELIQNSFEKNSFKAKASFILRPASLNIEWVSILSLIEPGDEIELLWCADWETRFELQNEGFHYDCVRIVIHKTDHRQYHIRLHTVIGTNETRLIKLW